MLTELGKRCRGTTPPANCRWMFLSQQARALCEMKCPVISFDDESLPEEFNHRAPSVLAGTADLCSPCNTTARGHLGSGGRWC